MDKRLELLGKKLEKLRGNLSREEFGNRLNPQVSKDAVGKWERGAVNIPYLTLCEIAREFGTSVSSLVGDDAPILAPPRQPTPQEMLSFLLDGMGLHGENEILKLSRSIGLDSTKRILSHREKLEPIPEVKELLDNRREQVEALEDEVLELKKELAQKDAELKKNLRNVDDKKRRE